MIFNGKGVAVVIHLIFKSYIATNRSIVHWYKLSSYKLFTGVKQLRNLLTLCI